MDHQGDHGDDDDVEGIDCGIIIGSNHGDAATDEGGWDIVGGAVLGASWSDIGYAGAATDKSRCGIVGGAGSGAIWLDAEYAGADADEDEEDDETAAADEDDEDLINASSFICWVHI